MSIVRFKGGQMMHVDRIVGLFKWKNYDTDELFICVETLGGSVNLDCASEEEQNDMLLTLSKQLERYLNPVDLIDLDFANISEKQKIN